MIVSRDSIRDDPDRKYLIMAIVEIARRYGAARDLLPLCPRRTTVLEPCGFEGNGVDHAYRRGKMRRRTKGTAWRAGDLSPVKTDEISDVAA